MGSVIYLGLILVAAAALWGALRPRPLFEIRIEHGRASITRGKAPASFAGEVLEICNRHGVERAAIRGRARASRVAIECSADIPPRCQQQIRNVWNLTGWKPR